MKICVIFFYRFNYIAKVANYYNMVRVAAEMEISTVHETIIHKFVQCTDIFLKSSKMQSFTYLADTMMKMRQYHRYGFLKLSEQLDAIIEKVISYKID